MRMAGEGHWSPEASPVPMAWISPTSTSTLDVRLIAGSVPPAPVFEVQVTSSVTVGLQVERPALVPSRELR